MPIHRQVLGAPSLSLLPVLGALVVTLLVTKFAPEARGHGVPEVMDAVYYAEGRIRPVVAAVKSLASAVAIGSGSAVGREGPIIQIGASLGSTIGQIIPLAAWQRITLVAAGAGAGIAATFNTPIGGVMFAIELMMPEVSVRTFLPVALATGTATDYAFRAESVQNDEYECISLVAESRLLGFTFAPQISASHPVGCIDNRNRT